MGDNLALYGLAVSELSRIQQDAFANCFIGALSTLVSESVWQTALATAARTTKNICPDEEGEANRG